MFMLAESFADAGVVEDNRRTPSHHHRTVSNEFQWIGATIVAQFAAWPVRFLVFASGLIAITLIKANARLPSARAICPTIRETPTMATPYPGNVTPLVPAVTLSRTGDPNHPPVRSWRRVAPRLEDFKAVPSHAIILCVIYPVLGLVLARLALAIRLLPLLFPLAAGFALLGPFAALGL